MSGAPVDLTATEFDLLSHLMARPGRVFTREELLSEVWGYSAAGGTRTVDVHVAQVRAKLGPASPDPHRARRRLRGQRPRPPPQHSGPGAARWPLTGPDRSSVLDTLSSRTVLLCVAVALVAAIVTVAVSIPLISGAARAQAEATLDRLAELTVATLEQSSFEPAPSGLDEVLSSQEISAYLIGPQLRTAPGCPPPTSAPRSPGPTINAEVTFEGEDYLAAARPVSGGYAVVLLAPLDTVVEPPLQGLRRLLAAVVVGVAVASVIGYLRVQAAHPAAAPVRRDRPGAVGRGAGAAGHGRRARARSPTSRSR